MATIMCPHCGKEMYELLEKCPNCGGPVESEALKEKREEEEKVEWGLFEEFMEKRNKREKIAFLVSCVAGTIICFMFSKNLSQSSGLGEILLRFLFFYLLGVGWVFIGACFGAYKNFKIFRNIAGLISFFVCCALFVFAACLKGSFYDFPKALFRLILRKPLVSEKECLEMYMA